MAKANPSSSSSSSRSPQGQSHRAANPLESPPSNPQTEETDILWSSQTTHWQATPQAIRLLEDNITSPEQPALEELTSAYENGAIEPEPVAISLRNRQGQPIKCRSQWDGLQLHLDIHPTRELSLPPAHAARALWRHCQQQYGNTPALLALLLATLLCGMALIALVAVALL